MNASLLAVLLAVAPAASAEPRRASPAAGARSLLDASFECPVPAGWAAQRTPDGVRLAGPSKDGLATLLVLRYVPPDDREFKSADAYLERQSRLGPYASKDDRVEPVKDVLVAGRAAKRVERRGATVVGGEARRGMRVPLREVHVVVPAAKGFYVLMLLTPEPLYARTGKELAAVLAGFKPKL